MSTFLDSTVTVEGAEALAFPLMPSCLPQISSLQNDFLDHDADPFPETNKGVRESHGTYSAGVVGMEKGNGKCGVGVAFNAFITGCPG